MIKLDNGEGFNDTKQILFQQHIVQGVEMTLDEVVSLQLSLEFFQNFVKALEGSVGVGISDSSHGGDIPSPIFQRKLPRDDGVDVLGGVLHNFTQKHIFETLGGIFGVLQTVICLKRLEKVRITGFVILFLGMQDPRLGVNGTLKGRGAIDGVSGCPGGCESGSRTGNVAKSVLNTAFKEMDFDQESLIVKLLNFVEEGSQKSEGSLVILRLEGEVSKTGLQPLTKESSLFSFRPLNTVTHKL